MAKNEPVLICIHKLIFRSVQTVQTCSTNLHRYEQLTPNTENCLNQQFVMRTILKNGFQSTLDQKDNFLSV